MPEKQIDRGPEELSTPPNVASSAEILAKAAKRVAPKGKAEEAHEAALKLAAEAHKGEAPAEKED